MEESASTGLARGTAVRKVRRMDVRSIVGAAVCTTMLAGSAWGQDVPVPSLTQENGRHVLLVDGRPFIILGGQVTNSSNYVVALPRVWQVPGAERQHHGNACRVGADRGRAKDSSTSAMSISCSVRPRAEAPTGLALVRHVEGWRWALHPGMGEDRSEAISANRPRRQAGELVLALRPCHIEADKAAYTHLLRHYVTPTDSAPSS